MVTASVASMLEGPNHALILHAVKGKEFWKLVSVAAMLKLHRPMIDFLEHVLERQMN